MKRKTLTLAEQFKREGLREGRREGRRKGLLQGRQEGRQEGRTEGARELARQAMLRALEPNHGELSERLVEAIKHIESLLRLKSLLDRATFSTTFEDFPAGL